jgi:hypothetical protein
MRVPIFLAVFLLQIAATIGHFVSTCSCLSLPSWTVYLFHHAFDVFVFWSPLFLTKPLDFMIHLAICVITGLHWLTNNNLCFLTVYLNRRCGYPDEEWLDSLKNMLGLRRASEYFHFIWIGLLMAYDIAMLMK